MAIETLSISVLARNNTLCDKRNSKLSWPILLIAEELDTVIVPQQLKDIYQVANEPKEIKIIAGIGHDYRRNKDENKIANKEVVKVLSEHKRF